MLGDARHMTMTSRQRPRVASVPWEDDVLAVHKARAVAGTSDLSPVQRLMLAVLEDGIDALARFGRERGPVARSIVETEQAWMRSRDRHWLFSFENCCLHLGIDADYLRDGLERRGWLPDRPRVGRTTLCGGRGRGRGHRVTGAPAAAERSVSARSPRAVR